jgi:hypothetical protein
MITGSGPEAFSVILAPFPCNSDRFSSSEDELPSRTMSNSTVSIKTPFVTRDKKAQGGIVVQDMTANLDRTGFERKFKRNAVDYYATIIPDPTLHRKADFARKVTALRPTLGQKNAVRRYLPVYSKSS